MKKPSALLGWKAFFVLLLIPSVCSAQNGLPSIHERAFQDGEELKYDVHYEWKGIWTKVAKAVFSAEKDSCPPSIPCYRFQGKGWTLPFYDVFFKVRDTYRSWARMKDLSPIRFYRKVREGGERYAEAYRFDEEDRTARFQSTEWEGTKSFSYPRNALDVLTAIYYCRSIQLDAMSVGDTVPIDLILGDEVHSTHFVYKGIERYEHPNGKEYRCHHIEPELIEGSIFKEGDRMKVLVTADDRKVPVFVDTEIMVGTIKVYLAGMKGTIDP